MTQAITALIQTGLEYVAQTAYNIATKIGLSEATARAVAWQAVQITKLGGQLLIAVGISYLTRPELPGPTEGKLTQRQTMPARISAYGRARVAGYYMLYESAGEYSYDVIALHHGEIDGYETWYAHDDEVQVRAIDGSVSPAGATPNDGRYSPHNVINLFYRTGLATETAYAEIVADLPAIWTDDHRGDGIASVGLTCKRVVADDQGTVYPYGLCAISAVARWLKSPVDPRTGVAGWTDNPAICIADYLTSTAHGQGFDWATRIAPALADWQAAADICDEPVPLAAGGTEPRYRLGGWWRHDNDPAEVLKAMLQACDGWLYQRSDGAFVLKVGKYEAPTVTLTDEHIVGYTVDHGAADERAVNELIVSFTSPGHVYNEVACDPWRDEADILARGRVRSQPFAAPWVQSFTQARRLAKREMARSGARLRGTLVTTLYGLQALGERYLRVQISELPTLADAAIEVLNLEIDIANLSITIDWILADPAIDAWDPAAEEGAPPALAA